MKDLMIDLETLGTSNNALITQIGACFFDRKTGEIGKQFLINIDIQSGIDAGFTIDGGALAFWFDQPRESATFLNAPVSVDVAAHRFFSFAKNAKHVWSHATFDFCLISNFYNRMKMQMPFHYSSTKDIRTLVELAGFTREDDAIRSDAHDALKDCIYQVGYCVKAINKLLEVKQ